MTIRALALLTAAALLATPASARADAAPALTWTSCDLIYQCSAVQVPLDHDDPDGEQLTVKLRRLPAAGPDRIGALFLNPGGPGLAATDLVNFTGLSRALGPRVLSRFDIVAVDPRGTAGAAPFRCDPAPGVDPVEPVAGIYPHRDEYDQQLASDAYIRKSCAATGPETIHHSSTADSARDLDVVREALGEERISFYGTSYGAFLGETYAALFGSRVRAMVLDSTLDPDLLAAGAEPMSARVGTLEASSAALDAALSRCDAVGVLRCPLAGRAKQRWLRVRQSLAGEPLALPGMTVDDKTFTLLSQNALATDRLSGLPLPTLSVWAAFMKGIDLLRFGPVAQRNDQLRLLARRVGQLPADVTGGLGGTRSVQCVDAANPADPRAWIRAAEEAETRHPEFAAYSVWSTSVCAGWPGSAADAYRGPFVAATPVLFAGTTHDPSTGIAGQRTTSARYPGSRLVEVDTFGHTAIGKSTRCLTPLTDDYLIEQKLPERSVSCEPDHQLFE